MMRDDRPRRGSPFLQMVEWLMLAVAVVCLEWYGLRMFDIHRRQSAAREAIERSLAEAPPAEPELPSTVPFGDLIGRLDIPRLKISAPVEAGENASVLDYAVGYLPDTPLPWQTGNSAFAAHRDRLFRPLERIRVGDDIELATKYGNLHYKVSRTLIVNPTELWVLKPTADADLTLITCFPFRYVGNAPQRFIVQARKIEPPT
jgi:sortase A